MKQLEGYLDDPAPFSLVILEAQGLDQRMKLSKLLGEKALVVQAELSDDPEVRAQMVSDMAQKMAAELGVQLEPEAALRTLTEFTWKYYLKHPEFLTLVNSENLGTRRGTSSSPK